MKTLSKATEMSDKHVHVQKSPTDKCLLCGHEFKDHHISSGRYCRKWVTVTDWVWDFSRVFTPKKPSLQEAVKPALNEQYSIQKSSRMENIMPIKLDPEKDQRPERGRVMPQAMEPEDTSPFPTLEIGKRYWLDNRCDVSGVYVGNLNFNQIEGDYTDRYEKDQYGNIGFALSTNFFLVDSSPQETVKHTAGPWRVGNQNDGWSNINGEGWTALAKVCTRLQGKASDNEEGLANAELIARAPQMLVELNQLRAEKERLTKDFYKAVRLLSVVQSEIDDEDLLEDVDEFVTNNRAVLDKKQQ